MTNELERVVSPKIMLAVSKLGAIVFRQNVGQAWVGTKVIHLKDGSVKITDARPISMGLTTGSLDLIGWTTVEVTPEMVGQRVAVFTAIEAKRTVGGRTSKEQQHFAGVVSKAGGISGIANSPEAGENIILRWVREVQARLPGRGANR
jgi:hypothetical protein